MLYYVWCNPGSLRQNMNVSFDMFSQDISLHSITDSAQLCVLKCIFLQASKVFDSRLTLITGFQLSKAALACNDMFTHY